MTADSKMLTTPKENIKGGPALILVICSRSHIDVDLLIGQEDLGGFRVLGRPTKLTVNEAVKDELNETMVTKYIPR